jgi:hypothetical protein
LDWVYFGGREGFRTPDPCRVMAGKVNITEH